MTCKVSEVINKRRLQFAGHRYRAGNRRMAEREALGLPELGYVDCLVGQMGCSVVELKHRMLDRQMWKAYIENRLRWT